MRSELDRHVTPSAISYAARGARGGCPLGRQEEAVLAAIELVVYGFATVSDQRVHGHGVELKSTGQQIGYSMKKLVKSLRKQSTKRKLSAGDGTPAEEAPPPQETKEQRRQTLAEAARILAAVLVGRLPPNHVKFLVKVRPAAAPPE